MGEHGDSEFAPVSQMMLATKRISEVLEDKCNGYCLEDMKKIEEQVRTAAYKIIEAKNATYYGIGMAITRIVKAILGDENSVLTVSAKLCGEYGCRNAFAGVPCIIGRNGVKEIIELSLTEDELNSFKNSVDVLEKGFEGVI
jgi:L-lactate dehydrogenase